MDWDEYISNPLDARLSLIKTISDQPFLKKILQEDTDLDIGREVAPKIKDKNFLFELGKTNNKVVNSVLHGLGDEEMVMDLVRYRSQQHNYTEQFWENAVDNIHRNDNLVELAYRGVPGAVDKIDDSDLLVQFTNSEYDWVVIHAVRKIRNLNYLCNFTRGSYTDVKGQIIRETLTGLSLNSFSEMELEVFYANAIVEMDGPKDYHPAKDIKMDCLQQVDDPLLLMYVIQQVKEDRLRDFAVWKLKGHYQNLQFYTGEESMSETLPVLKFLETVLEDLGEEFLQN